MDIDQQREKNSFKRVLSSQNYQPIRITFDTQKLDSFYLQSPSVTVRNQIDKVLDMIKKFLSEQIKVIQETQNIKFEDPSGKCQDFQVSDEDKNIGIQDSDLHIYVSMVDVYQNWIFQQSPCQFKTDNYRPVFASLKMNFFMCEQLLQDWSDKNFMKFMDLILHELIHVLGFSENMIDHWIDKNGNKYNNHYELISNVTYHLKTPKVLEVSRQHYECQSLQSLAMENQGGFHWEKTHLNDEIMTGSISSTKQKFTMFTFALLEDTGYYQCTYKNLDITKWGYKKGCNFLQGCDASFPEFHDSSLTGCTFYQNSIGSATSEALTDSCMYMKFHTQKICYDAEMYTHYNDFNNQNFGESYGYNSKCFKASIQKSGTNDLEGSNCYQYQCDKNNNIYVYLGGELYYCDNNDKKCIITKKGNNQKFEGEIETVSDWDDFCNTSFQMCDQFCSKNGYCLQGICHCLPGFHGSACEKQCSSGQIVFNKLCENLTNCPTGYKLLEENKTCIIDKNYNISCNSQCISCISSYKDCQFCKDINLQPPNCCEYMCEKCSQSSSYCTKCSHHTRENTPVCQCREEYFELSPQVSECGKCSVKCKTCSSENQCQICAQNRENSPNCDCMQDYKEDSNQICQPCDPLTRNSSDCSCKLGYYDVGVLKCQPCNYMCKTCDNQNTCKTCWDLTTRNNDSTCSCKGSLQDTHGQKQCSICKYNCQTCEQDLVTCLTCEPDTRQNVQNCICKPGYFEVKMFKCEACQFPCQLCQSENVCDTCPQGSNRVPPNCDCMSGYYENQQNQCLKCIDGCSQCKNNNICEQCINPQNKNDNCECTIGYLDRQDYQCKQCIFKKCELCEENQICKKCVQSNTRVASSLSCECIAGYYEVQQIECNKCPAKCNLCDDQGKCTQCSGRQNAQQLLPCDCNLGYYDQNGICEKCIDDCQVCSTGANCEDLQFCQSVSYDIDMTFDKIILIIQSPIQFLFSEDSYQSYSNCKNTLESITLEKLGLNPQCLIIRNDSTVQIIIQLSQITTIDLETDQFQFKSNIFRKISCSNYNISNYQVRSKLWKNFQSNNKPSGQIIGNDIVNACDKIELFFTDIKNDGKRQLQDIQWEIYCDDCNRDAIDEWLSEQNPKFQIQISTKDFKMKEEVVFKISFSNYMGQSATEQFKIQIQDEYSISAQMSNFDQKLWVWEDQFLSIKIQQNIKVCDQVFEPLKISYTLYISNHQEEKINQLKEGSFQELQYSVQFQILAYTATPNQYHYVLLETNNGFEYKQLFKVFYEYSDIQVQIDQGDRTVSTNDTLNLKGKYMDLDNNSDQGFITKWKCHKFGTEQGCHDRDGQLLQLEQTKNLNLNITKFQPQQTLVFTLVAIKNNRYNEHKVNIHLTDSDIPNVDIEISNIIYQRKILIDELLEVKIKNQKSIEDIICEVTILDQQNSNYLGKKEFQKRYFQFSIQELVDEVDIRTNLLAINIAVKHSSFSNDYTTQFPVEINQIEQIGRLIITSDSDYKNCGQFKIVVVGFISSNQPLSYQYRYYKSIKDLKLENEQINKGINKDYSFPLVDFTPYNSQQLMLCGEPDGEIIIQVVVEDSMNAITKVNQYLTLKNEISEQILEKILQFNGNFEQEYQTFIVMANSVIETKYSKIDELFEKLQFLLNNLDNLEQYQMLLKVMREIYEKYEFSNVGYLTNMLDSNSQFIENLINNNVQWTNSHLQLVLEIFEFIDFYVKYSKNDRRNLDVVEKNILMQDVLLKLIQKSIAALQKIKLSENNSFALKYNDFEYYSSKVSYDEVIILLQSNSYKEYFNDDYYFVRSYEQFQENLEGEQNDALYELNYVIYKNGIFNKQEVVKDLKIYQLVGQNKQRKNVVLKKDVTLQYQFDNSENANTDSSMEFQCVQLNEKQIWDESHCQTKIINDLVICKCSSFAPTTIEEKEFIIIEPPMTKPPTPTNSSISATQQQIKEEITLSQNSLLYIGIVLFLLNLSLMGTSFYLDEREKKKVSSNIVDKQLKQDQQFEEINPQNRNAKIQGNWWDFHQFISLFHKNDDDIYRLQRVLSYQTYLFIAIFISTATVCILKQNGEMNSGYLASFFILTLAYLRFCSFLISLLNNTVQRQLKQKIYVVLFGVFLLGFQILMLILIIYFGQKLGDSNYQFGVGILIPGLLIDLFLSQYIWAALQFRHKNRN